jgi:CelD/BcsL family acetyltransferase involved in cellulose biosynthesis
MGTGDPADDQRRPSQPTRASTAGRPKGLLVEIIHADSAIEALVPEWEALAVDVDAQPFSLPALGLAWHRHLGKGRMEIVTCRDKGGRLRGLLALQRRRKGTLEILEPLGQDLGAVTSILSRHEDEPSTAPAIWSHLAERGEALVVNHHRHGAALRHLRRERHLEVSAALVDECPVIELSGWDDATDFLSSPDRAGLRKKLRKAERALGNRRFDVELVSTPDAISEAITALTPIYDDAEQERPRLHLARGRYSEFFADALRHLASRGQLTIAVASVDGAPAAFDVYVVSGSTAYAILGRFRPSDAAYSPGQLLTRAGIDWAIGMGLDTIDLQLGAELYKLRWSTDTYDTVKVVAGPPATTRRLRATIAALEGAHRLRSRIGSDLESRRASNQPPPLES